jgi:type IV pilus assembly protein PilA
MFLQNLRAKVGARLNGEGESGFTLIELLVVMLILGILAAIALPAFFNQKEKAGDAKAKEMAHTVQVALESCSTDNGGTYPITEECSETNLKSNYEGTIDEAAVALNAEGTGVTYNIVVTSSTTHTFTITRNDDGSMDYTCTPFPEGGGGCPPGGDWSQ